jgi:methylenetetrahydrofolate reductase (NADPH)
LLVSAAVGPIPHADLKHRIVAFATGASTEIAPQDEELIPHLATRLPAETCVYVAHTPNAALADVVRVSLRVETAGLRASPHLVARRIESRQMLEDAISALRDGGVEQVLVVAGDADEPRGRFSSALDLLETEILVDAGIERIGVAGHPEGHRAIGPAALWRALGEKQLFAERNRIRMHIVTQFGFDPGAILAWAHHLPEHGITLPVYVGMAGPAELAKQIKYAMACGVGASLRGILRNMNAMRNIAGLAPTPAEMLAGLARGGGAGPGTQLVHPHFFSFGGSVATARWLRAVVDGNFEVTADGQLTLNM